ncbi:MAG: phage tail protein [Rodentibacter sp.]|nr:MAG TPA: minor tail protein [Caudoviricetes sp.]
MALDILPYCPKPGYTVKNEPRRKVNKFGDGYEQRMVDGLNPLLRKYSLTFKVQHKSAVDFDRFLRNKGGVTAFLFREKANDNQLIKVVCPDWSKTVGKTHTEFSCSFEEVV